MMKDVCITVGPERLCWGAEVFFAALAVECLFYIMVAIFGVEAGKAFRRWRSKPRRKEMNHFPPMVIQRGDDDGR